MHVDIWRAVQAEFLFMPRRCHIEFEGAFYHVMDRGDRREAIFEDDEDRRRFLAALGEACRKTGWRVHAYVLLVGQLIRRETTPDCDLNYSTRDQSVFVEQIHGAQPMITVGNNDLAIVLVPHQ